MKAAYHYDPKTLVYLGKSNVDSIAGYEDYILPQFATWVATPEFDEKAEQAKFDAQNQKWIVEPKPVAVTAYHKQTREPKLFDDASLVADEYTLKKPLTQWDEWLNDVWVTNESDKYIAEYNLVDDARRAAYFQVVTPLIDEAKIKRDLIKTPEAIAEADELEQQALAARQKIQTENPWPIPPNN